MMSIKNRPLNLRILFFAMFSALVGTAMNIWGPKASLDTRLYYSVAASAEFFAGLSPEQWQAYLLGEVLDLFFIVGYCGLFFVLLKRLGLECKKAFVLALSPAIFDYAETLTILGVLTEVLSLPPPVWLGKVTLLKWLSVFLNIGFILILLIKRKTERGSMSALNKIEFRQSNGQPTSLADYQGKVLLIVNVASKCGLTPQYDGLGKLFEQYREKGLMVLGFPANEFGAQEPGTNEEIQEFCRMNFGVEFPVLEKIAVKGADQHPLYKELTRIMPNALKKPDGKLEENLKKHGLFSEASADIMWNFEKFLIDRQGQVVQRFAPDIAPDDPQLVAAIEKELAK